MILEIVVVHKGDVDTFTQTLKNNRDFFLHCPIAITISMA